MSIINHTILIITFFLQPFYDMFNWSLSLREKLTLLLKPSIFLEAIKSLSKSTIKKSPSLIVPALYKTKLHFLFYQNPSIVLY